MQEKMTVVKSALTNHILGAVTRTGNPEGKISALDMTGEYLTIKNKSTGNDEFRIDSEKILITEYIDLNKELFSSPYDYIAKDGKAVKPDKTFSGVVLMENNGKWQVKVTLSEEPAEDIYIVVQVRKIGSAEFYLVKDMLANEDETEKIFEFEFGDIKAGSTYTVLVFATSYEYSLEEYPI